MRRRTGGHAVSANRRRSTFLASRTSVGTAGGAGSNSSGSLAATGCAPSCGWSKRSCAEGCTRRSMNRGVAAAGCGGLQCLSRCPDQCGGARGLPLQRHQHLAAHAELAWPEGESDVAAYDRATNRWLPKAAYHASMAERAPHRQTPKVEPVREYRLPGSVRETGGNARPHRDVDGTGLR
jgi:hypothetical protein